MVAFGPRARRLCSPLVAAVPGDHEFHEPFHAEELLADSPVFSLVKQCAPGSVLGQDIGMGCLATSE
jgi:hypothetical protein